MLIAAVVIKKSSVVSYRLAKYVNEHYFKDTNFRFHCGSIEGDLINHVVLKNIAIRYEDGKRKFDVFKAGGIDVNFSIYEVMKLNLVIDNLRIDDARLRLEKHKTGKLLIPSASELYSDGHSSVSPRIKLSRFLISNFNFVYADSSRTVSIGNMDLEGTFQLEGGKGELEVENSRAFLHETKTAVHSLRFSASVTENSLVLNDFISRLDRSYVMASGSYKSGAIERLQLIFNPLDMEEISSLGLIPENSGELGGNISFKGRPDSLNISGMLTGKAFGILFSGFSFAGWSGDEQLSLDKLEGKVFGSYVNGSLNYRRGDKGGYIFEGICRDLDISEGFIPEEGAPSTDFSGRVRVNYNHAEDKYLFHAELDSSSIEGFRSDHMNFDARWTGNEGLLLNGIEIQSEGYAITGSGSINEKAEADLIFSLKGSDLDYLWNYLSMPVIGCAAVCTGRAAGPMDMLKINLNGIITNASYLFAEIDSSSVQAEIRNVPSDSVTATVDLRGPDISLANYGFSEPHMLFEAAEGRINVKDLSFAKGDTLISSDFDISPGDSVQNILFKHILIKLPGETWISVKPVRLKAKANDISIDSLLLASDKGELALSGEYKGENRTFLLEASGKDIESAVLQNSLSLPLGLRGKCRFAVDARGSIEEPMVNLIFHLNKGSIGGMDVDSFDLAGEYADSTYKITKLTVKNDGDSIRAGGWWTLGLPPAKLARHGIQKKAYIKSAWSADLQSYDYPMNNVFNALGRRLPIDGAFNGNIDLVGDPSRSKMEITGTVSPVSKSTASFPEFNVAAVFDKDHLDIQSINMNDGETEAEISGSIPVEFDMKKGLSLRSSDSVKLKLKASSSNLGSAAGYFDRIRSAEGQFSSDIEVEGPIDHPNFKGTANLQNCRINMEGIEETGRGVNAKIICLGNLIQLASIDGKIGEKGSFYGSGYAELDGLRIFRYRTDLFFKDFVLSSIHEFESLQDGSLTITSGGEKERTLTPMIAGSVKIKQASITRPIAAEPGEAAPLALPSDNPGWFCNLEIDAPKNILIKNPGLKMELGGNVILKRDKSGLYLRGELNVLRGSYSLYNNKFKITDGVFDFSAATSFRPELNINAYNVYRYGEVEHRIFLNLSWPKDKREPQVTLSSDDPRYSETDIWKMMGGSYLAGAGDPQDAGEWDAAGTAQSLASNYFESLLNAQMKDMTIDVESRTLGGDGNSTKPEREMTVAIGKYLSEDLYFKYRQGLSITTEREYDIEYRVGNMLILRSQIIRHSGRRLLGKSSQAANEINFDIKLRFEY